MRKLLKRMGWINYRGRTDWKEICIDIVSIVIVLTIIAMIYLVGRQQ